MTRQPLGAFLTVAFARPLWKVYSVSVSVMTGRTGLSCISKWGPRSTTPRQCSTFTRITSSMGAVKVTVSAGWFITPPRPSAGTVGQMIRRALSVMVASKL